LSWQRGQKQDKLTQVALEEEQPELMQEVLEYC
jgi:hypothetical protein